MSELDKIKYNQEFHVGLFETIACCFWGLCAIGIIIDTHSTIKETKKEYCSDFKKESTEHKNCTENDLPKKIKNTKIAGYIGAAGIILFCIFFIIKFIVSRYYVNKKARIEGLKL